MVKEDSSLTLGMTWCGEVRMEEVAKHRGFLQPPHYPQKEKCHSE